MKKFIADTKAAWKKTPVGNRKRIKILVVMFASIFTLFGFILFYEGGGDQRTDSQVTGISAQATRDRSIDRTQELQAVQDADFEAQLREVERRRRESAARAGESHITDVSHMNWRTLNPSEAMPFAINADGGEVSRREWERMANSEREDAIQRYADENGMIAGALDEDGNMIPKNRWDEMSDEERAEAIRRFEEVHGFRIQSLECNCGDLNNSEIMPGMLDENGRPITRAEWERMTPEEREQARRRADLQSYKPGMVDANGNPITREQWERMTPEERAAIRAINDQSTGYRPGMVDANGNPITREEWERMTPEERAAIRAINDPSTGYRPGMVDANGNPITREEWERMTPEERAAIRAINDPSTGYRPGMVDANGNPITREEWERMTPEERASILAVNDTYGFVPSAIDRNGNRITQSIWDQMNEDEKRKARLRFAEYNGFIPGALDDSGMPISSERWNTMSQEEQLQARKNGGGLESSVETLNGMLTEDCTAMPEDVWRQLSRVERRQARERYDVGCEPALVASRDQGGRNVEVRNLNVEERQAHLSRRMAAVRAIRENLRAGSAGSSPQDYEVTIGQSYQESDGWSNEENITEETTPREVGGFVPGDRLVGFTTGTVNSDTSAWVEVEIAQGPLKGSTIGLTPQRIEGYIVMAANTITSPNRQVAPISGIAINPEMGMSNAFSSHTDYHRLARFGSAFAYGAFGTVVDYIGRQGTEIQQPTTGAVIAETRFPTRDLVIGGLAAGAAEASGDLAELARGRPPTVTVDRGVRVVLVITQPQEIEWLPEEFVIRD